jgi:glycosyltransferase involved in cell wall biosynthesis
VSESVSALASVSGDRTRPHLVMLVANDVVKDTRVRKSALAASAMGFRVTLVGLSPDERRWSTFLGEQVEIVRVPVDHRLRDARAAEVARRRSGAVWPWVADPKQDQLNRLRLALAARQAVTADGVTAPLWRSVAKGRRLALRVRTVGRRKGAAASALAYRAWSKGLSRLPAVGDPGRVLPEVDDYELVLGPLLDVLEPDLIHAHDIHFVGVVDRAVARRRAAGQTCGWVYDSHEWVSGIAQYGSRTNRVVSAWARLEAGHIEHADRVVTVSDPIAEALQRRYRLPRRPDVVLNVPMLGVGRPATGGVRAVAGVPDDAPLLVFSGGITPARGVTTGVDALQYLPDAHLVVVSTPTAATHGAAAVRRRAQELGLTDRVHVIDPVRPDEVVDFLAGADAGLILLHHFPSHEMALPNKLFEYLQAQVPVVVSDCTALKQFVTREGIGTVHVAGEARALAEACRQVLGGLGGYRARCADPQLRAAYTWQAQATIHQQGWRDLLQATRPELAAALSPAEPLPDVEPAETSGAGESGGTAAVKPVTLAIGPLNSAGQADAWARAAERYLPDVHGWVVAVRKGTYDYHADEVVDRATHQRDVDWQLRLSARLAARATHVMLEAGRPLLGGLNGRDVVADADALTRAGLAVAVACHGSEVRSPRRHRATHQFSPFADPREARTRVLQSQVDVLAARLATFHGPIFVSTPDQLVDVPRAIWLPVVVDLAQWPLQAPILEPAAGGVGQRPRFVHAPSNPWLKGSDQVEKVLRPLADRGLIEYEVVSGVSPAAAADAVRRADVVVDQLLLGLYGVLACEAMASGKLVLGHVGDALRSRVPAEVPMVEVTPATLAETVHRVLDDPDWARGQASCGRAFVETWHDGRRSAAALAPFLGRSPGAPGGREQEMGSRDA